MDSSGRVFLSAGGPFQEYVNLGGYMVDFAASSTGHFYAARTTKFTHCASNCADAGSWSEMNVPFTSASVVALCVVNDNNVLTIGSNGSNDGIANKWNGTTLGGSNTIGGTNPSDCFRAASGDFYIPSQDGIVRYAPTLGSYSLETIPGAWRGGGSTTAGEWVTSRGPTFARHEATGWVTVGTPAPRSTWCAPWWASRRRSPLASAQAALLMASAVTSSTAPPGLRCRKTSPR